LAGVDQKRIIELLTCANTLYKNGTLIATKALDSPAAWTGFTLGQNNYNTINGDVAEVLVYNSALSDTDRQGIETYLQNKYGF
jgi:hypothetical protein